MIRTTITALALIALSVPAQAHDENSPHPGFNAHCQVTTSDASFNGPCDFRVGRFDGSFSITSHKPGDRFRRMQILPNIWLISVTIRENPPGKPAVANVIGLTSLGISSAWGRAERSPVEPACWVSVRGEDNFKICAWRT